MSLRLEAAPRLLLAGRPPLWPRSSSPSGDYLEPALAGIVASTGGAVTRIMRSVRAHGRLIVAMALLNLLVMAAYWWSLTDSDTVLSVRVNDDSLVADVNGSPLSVSTAQNPPDYMALFLEDFSSHRAFVPVGRQDTAAGRLARRTLQPFPWQQCLIGVGRRECCGSPPRAGRRR